MPSKTSADEQQIRDLIAAWVRASFAEDISAVLNLMAEDVIFLIAGQPPMRGRDGFAAASCASKGKIRFDDLKSDVQEIQVFGNIAYCWTKLSIAFTTLPDGKTIRRSGNTLSIFRKESSGEWVLWRDANMLTPEN